MELKCITNMVFIESVTEFNDLNKQAPASREPLHKQFGEWINRYLINE